MGFECWAAGPSSPPKALPGLEMVSPEAGVCLDCWGLGLCRWGSPRPAWVLAKTPGFSISLLCREFSRLEPASLSKVFPVHPSQTSRRSSSRPWRRWPGRPRHWTLVARTGEKVRNGTKVQAPLSRLSLITRKCKFTDSQASSERRGFVCASCPPLPSRRSSTFSGAATSQDCHQNHPKEGAGTFLHPHPRRKRRKKVIKSKKGMVEGRPGGASMSRCWG